MHISKLKKKSPNLLFYATTTIVDWQSTENRARLIVALQSYFEKTIKNIQTRTVPASDSCHYLTSNKESSLIHLCTVLGAMGYGVTQDDLHEFADDLVNQDVDERQRVPISKHVTEGLLLRHKELVKVVLAASLDPKRVH